MSRSRYSEMEMNQWHDAAANCAREARNRADESDAPRHEGAGASMAKGQADTKQSRTADAKMQTPDPKQDNWASECLFDCYNG